MTAFAPILQAFFTDRLITQRQASGHTIATYRDTFRLLLGFAADQHRTPPQRLRLEDLDAPFIAAFLDHLETVRHNSIRTRNARLTAIHSLFGYAALRYPEHAALISRVLAIPAKRYDRNLLTWLTEPETEALLAACDRGTWTGRRDHTMLLLTVQTGLPISELTALSCSDVHLGDGPHVHCLGKGRKHRDTPLLPSPLRHCVSGSPNAADTPTIRCFPPPPADGSAATPSNNESASTTAEPAEHARRSPPRK